MALPSLICNLPPVQGMKDILSHHIGIASIYIFPSATVTSAVANTVTGIYLATPASVMPQECLLTPSAPVLSMHHALFVLAANSEGFMLLFSLCFSPLARGGVVFEIMRSGPCNNLRDTNHV